ncbi:MAG: hypothetical protein V1820_04645 [archaeon]
MPERKSFVFSFEIFLALILFGFSVIVLSASAGRETGFRERIFLISRADLLDDTLSSLQASGRIYSLVRPLEEGYYQELVSNLEKSTGEKLCLYLDGTPLYRENCKPLICSRRFFAQAALSGIVDFRKAELCISGAGS